MAGDFVRQSRTAVGDRDLDLFVIKQRNAYIQLMPVAVHHRLICIAQEIDQQLLHLDAVGAANFRSGQSKVACILNKNRKALDAPCHQGLSLANHRTGSR
jgi:hypothetical protein